MVELCYVEVDCPDAIAGSWLGDWEMKQPTIVRECWSMLDRKCFRSRSRYCYLTNDDERAFWAILKNEFPDLIVCRLDTTTITEYESLADAPDYSPIYLPDPGWKPRFGPDPDTDFPNLIRLLNGPPRSIGYIRSHISQLDPSRLVESGIRAPEQPYMRFVGEGSFQGHYRRNRPDEKIFVSRVFSLIGKFMTNDLELIDLETHDVLETVKGSIIWAAPDAVRRCQEDDYFFIYIYHLEGLGNRWVGAKAIPRPSKKRKNVRRRSS